jgi:hypothetical protein
MPSRCLLSCMHDLLVNNLVPPSADSLRRRGLKVFVRQKPGDSGSD